MVAGRRCPECDISPRMNYVGMSPRPNAPAHAVLECPHCGATVTVEQDDTDPRM